MTRVARDCGHALLCHVPRGLLAIFTLAMTQPARADDVGNYASFRAGAFGGLFIPNTTSWQGSGVLAGLPPFSASGQLSLKNGSAAGGFVGYTFDDFMGIEWLRRKVNLEFQLGVVNDSFEKLDGGVSLVGVGNFTGSFPLAGHVSTLAGMVNGLICPFGQRQIALGDHPITPFIGVGTGFARSNVTLQSFSLGQTVLPVNATSSETDPLFNFTVGFDITPFPASIPKLEIGVAYQYTRIFSNHLGSGSGIAANSGNVSVHIFGLVLEYRMSENS